MHLNLGAQNGIHAKLIARACIIFEELQQFGIDTKRDLSLGLRQLICRFHPYGIGLIRCITGVDQVIRHRSRSLESDLPLRISPQPLTWKQFG